MGRVLWGFQAKVGLVKPKEPGFSWLFGGEVLYKGRVRESVGRQGTLLIIRAVGEVLSRT